MIDLSDDERDAMTALLNVGVGRAAERLSTMIKSPVQLSVPRIALLDRTDAAAELTRDESAKLLAVGIDFTGPFSGRAVLLLPERDSLELVRAVFEGEVPQESIPDLQGEALLEIANIVLNGCLAVMANVLQSSLNMSLPTFRNGIAQDILAGSHPTPEQRILYLYINFDVQPRRIAGYIALVMDPQSSTELKAMLQRHIGQIEQSPGRNP